MGLLISEDRYMRTIKDPDDGTEYRVTYRHLSGFERNRIAALRQSAGEDSAEIDMGHLKARAVELAVVSWTFPFDKSWENIVRLRGEVFDRLYEYVSLDGKEPPEVIDVLPLESGQTESPSGDATAESG